MKLTPLEKKCLEEALIYAICDYEENLKYKVNNDFEPSEIKEQRQLLKGMERAHSKLAASYLKKVEF